MDHRTEKVMMGVAASCPVRATAVALFGALLGSVAMAGCSSAGDAASDQGAARRTIQQALDGQRQCAPLLGGIEPIVARGDDRDRPGVRALVAAGLIAPVTEARDGDVTYRPTPAAAPFVVRRRSGDNRMIDLCFGRRQVVAVMPAPREAMDTGPTLRYRYRIVDVPAWARRDDMRAAFPFLAKTLAGDLTAARRLPVKDGVPDTGFLDPALDLDGTREAFAFAP